MSRLIFEGNTTERFGDFFPKPFIEEVRVYEGSLEADIALYFQIEEDKDAATFLEETGLSELKIHLQLDLGARFEQYLDGGRPLDTLLGTRTEMFSTGGAYMSRLIGTPPQLSQFVNQHDFFYNSEGKRFIKFYMTIPYDLSDLSSIIVNTSIYLYCITLFSFNNDILTDAELYKTQYSDISYEKLFNADGALNAERQVVYLESGGNYYSKTPLMSLDRKHRKTNLINSRQVASRIQSIIQPFVGAVADADLISSVIQEQQRKPKFLIALQKSVNRFENKNATTVAGSLYGELVDEISAINSILVESDILQKRLEFNKIKDRRTERALVLNESELTTDNTKNMADPRYTFPDASYFAPPLMYRNLATNVAAKDFTFPEEAFIENKVYFFFDHEKALNYKSNISQVFNPYNILELFGNNSLNNLFPVQKAICTISAEGTSREYSFVDEYYNKTDHGNEDSFGMGYRVDLDNSGPAKYKSSYNYLYNGNERYTFTENFCERAFDTAKGLGGYRLRCYELDFLKAYDYVNELEFINHKVQIKDNTMRFYELSIRSPFEMLKNKLRRYKSLAEEFCSYNNIDGRFNDFFLSAVENEFEEPYPWVRGPLMYYSIFSLIYASWNFDGESATGRRTDGTPVDLQGIKDATLAKINEISPTAGNLDSVTTFVDQFVKLYEDFLDYGSFFDEQLALYTPTDGELTSHSLRNVNETKFLSSHVLVSNNVVIDTDLSVVNPDASDVTFRINTNYSRIRPLLGSPSAYDVTYEEMEKYIDNFNWLDQYTVTFKVNELVNGSFNRTIREEQQKTFTEFFQENLTTPGPGSPTVGEPERIADQLEEIIFPIYNDFHQTLYDLIDDRLKTYDDGRGGSEDDTDGNTPNEHYLSVFNIIDSNVDQIVLSMCDRRQFDKTGIAVRGDETKNITNRIFFNVEPKGLKDYFANLLFNYYIYSYYVDRRGMTLKDFMNNVVLDSENKIT